MRTPIWSCRTCRARCRRAHRSARGCEAGRRAPGLRQSARGRDPRAHRARRSQEARRFGTGLIGDISNTLASVAALRDAGLPGARLPRGARLQSGRSRGASRGGRPADRGACGERTPRCASASPRTRRIRCRRRCSRRSRDEVAAVPVERASRGVARGSGVPRRRRRPDSRGARGHRRVESRMAGAASCGPVEYLDRFGLLSDRLLVVHGVQLSDARTGPAGGGGIDAGHVPAQQPLGRRRRSAGRPFLRVRGPCRDWHRQPGQRRRSQRVRRDGGDAQAVARDPGASDPRQRHDATAPRRSGSADDYGTIEPGKRAALLAVRVPAGVEDVEEYLVGGIEPADVQWLDAWLTSGTAD